MGFSAQANDLFGIELSEAQVARFETYRHELAAWNERVNLTAITDPVDVQVRHYLDSLSVVRAAALRPGLRVVDVGTGAGFPGLALNIAFPELRVTLLESTGKKVAFLQHMIETLDMATATAIKARAEEAGHLPEHREQYDLVLARAVARLPALVEYMLPLATVGGRCVAMKGPSAYEETDDALEAVRILGGAVHDIAAVTLPGIPDPHYLIMIDKIKPTPENYPRRPGVPTRKPLG